MTDATRNTADVGLVTIATGRYIEFVPALIASAREHLLGLGPVFVLTDAEAVEADGDVTILSWGRMEWPLPTLLRYRAFTQYAQALSSVDVLLYTDADMLFVGDVDVRDASGLIAVRHPGFASAARADFPYEHRAASRAFVPKDRGTAYFCGGVQGGRTSSYLAAAVAIDAGIADDQARGITATWHDESHWNRYLIDHPADLALGADYCTPDVQRSGSSRILAITKDHASVRELTPMQRVQYVVSRVRYSLQLRLRRLSSRRHRR